MKKPVLVAAAILAAVSILPLSCAKEDNSGVEELYASFQVTDAQYNRYSSELAAVKTRASTAEEVRVAYDDLNLVKINSFRIWCCPQS